MKVLHMISGGDKGGAKTHVFALLSALQEDIDIMVACFMEGVFFQEIQEMPIPSILIKQKYRNDLTIVNKLVKHIRENRYELIHAHGARANFIAVFLKMFIKIPIITTVHSDYRLDFTSNLYKKMIFTELNAVALRFMDYYIAVSKSFKEMLIERDFDENKIYTVYNAIDFDKEYKFLEKDIFMKKYDVDYEGKVLVGIIGRFDKVKGHDLFVKAAKEVIEVQPNVLFLLAGEGDEQKNLEASIRKFGIEDNFEFLGFVDDIFSFINAIDINVLSSYSESFPYVLLEGAYMKKATVSTAVGGIPDLIINEKTGLLSKPADPIDLGMQILKLIKDQELRKTYGENLYEYAKTNFSKNSLKNKHLEIYNDVLFRQKEENKLFDVVLSGYYGFNNSGDEAILSAIIDNLRKQQNDIKIIVLSKRPADTIKKHKVYAVNRINFIKIQSILKRSRVFINGGGSLIQDITSTHSLVYYTMLMHVAKKLGLKIMLYANGIGPITKPSNINRAKNALKICDYITLREPESFLELEKLSINTDKVSLSSDPTLAINKIDEDSIYAILKSEGIDMSKKYFALSFRQWKYNDVNFIEKVSVAIDNIKTKYNLNPLFIPMQYPNDQIISNEIISKCKCECRILKNEYNVEELLGIVSKMDLVISMRLHTLIYAVSVGIPILGIVYDPKIKSFMDYIHQDKYIDTNNIDVKLIMDMVSDIFDNYEKTKTDIKEESDKLKNLCDKDSSIAISLLK